MFASKGMGGHVSCAWLGAAFFTLFLFIKFVDWCSDWMPKYVFFFIVGAVAIGLLIACR
jgi:hypothetical protein